MTDDVLVYTGLEISIRGPAAEVINQWRRRYDPAYLELEPHISLAYPPFVPLEQWELVKPVVMACLAGFEPFRVTLKEVGVFPGDSSQEPNVLWLKPEDGGVLDRIRQALEKQLPIYVPPMPTPYIPHVTIGFIQGSEALEQAFAQVQAELQPLEFTVTEVVYEVDDKGSGQKFIDVIPLLGASPVLGTSPLVGSRARRRPRSDGKVASRSKNLLARITIPREPSRETGSHAGR